MFKTHLLTTLRYFRKQKGFTFINLLGLTLGVSCSLFIFLWVHDEVSTDQFHEHKEQLYRVMVNIQLGNKEISTGRHAPYPLEEALENDFPEIEHVVSHTWNAGKVFRVEDNLFKESGIYASEEFFDVFTFPLAQGDPSKALADPSYGVISASLAAKLFGTDWQQQDSLLGTIIQIDRDDSFTLMGIFQDVPAHSSLQFDYVLPIEQWIKNRPWDESWGNNNYQQYALLRQDTDLQALNEKVASTITRYHKYLQDNSSIKVNIFLYPFQDLYLYGEFENGKPAGGRIAYVRIFSVVAFMVLLLACINFMNLATARSTQRAKEIGVRKAVGASRFSLMGQFLSESFLLSALSALTGIMLIHLLLPAFNAITGKELVLPFSNSFFWLALIVIVVFTGMLAGLYPAFLLSSFKTANIFRGNLKFGHKGIFIRKGLVLFQFVLSLLMIIGTLVVHWQIRYMQTKDLGLDKEQVLHFSLAGINEDQYEVIKQELLQQEVITGVSLVNQNPITINNSTSDPEWEGKDPNDRAQFRILTTDPDFLSTMNIPLVQGRNFNADMATDTVNYIINETAARVMDLEDPIGKTLEFWDQKGQIIGVVKDFHLQSLHTPIRPLIIRYHPDETWMALVKAEAGHTQEAIAGIQNLFQQYKPNDVFEYHFLDNEYERLYEKEATISHLANAFALLAIVIACLGLLGLAAYTAERRTKEIGIRKVLGASVAQVLWLLSQDFMKLILVAFLIAIPVAYYVFSDWLEQYAYRIDLSWWLFAIPGMAVTLLALLVIGGQSFKTATANPVDSLRYE